MRAVFLIMLLQFGASACVVHAEEYYRWVDENGTLHLSDTKPEPVLELEIDVMPLQRPQQELSPHSPPEPASPQQPDSPPAPPVASQVQILSPSNNSTIRSNEGNIPLSVATNLPLGDNQTVRVLLDGKVQMMGADLLLSNVDRGEHTIKVQLLQNGKVIASSKTITVFLHRAIKSKPASRARPPRINTARTPLYQ